VNAVVVLLLPLAVLAIGSSLRPGPSGSSMTVHPPGWSGSRALIQAFLDVAKVMFPFAILAAWRTWVHAGRWRDRGDQGWQGVAEAGACGLGIALLVLLPGIITRPMDAAPYVVAYGAAALVAGLTLGLLLRAAALVVLRLSGSGAAWRAGT
jgi:hypothetical protein